MKNYTASYKTYKVNGVARFEVIIYLNGKRVFSNPVANKEQQLRFATNFIKMHSRISNPQTINA